MSLVTTTTATTVSFMIVLWLVVLVSVILVVVPVSASLSTTFSSSNTGLYYTNKIDSNKNNNNTKVIFSLTGDNNNNKEYVVGIDYLTSNNDDDTNHTVNPYGDIIEEYTTSFISPSIPISIHNRNGYNHNKADFGFTKSKQGSIHTFVYYFTNQTIFCNPFNNANDESIQSNIFPNSNIELPFIAMISTSGISSSCSAVTIARNVQAIGASALVLAYEHCLCNDIDCMNAYGTTSICTNATTVTIPKDGSASVNDIHLPTFLLYKYESDTIIQTMKQSHPVLLEITWGIPPPHSVGAYVTKPVQHRMWMTAHDPLMDVSTLQELRLVTDSFSDDQAVFTPHYSIIDGKRYGCTGTTGGDNTNGSCEGLCVNNGRYCSVHGIDLSGRAILNETVRRLCIEKLYRRNNTGSDIYWTYIIQHRIHCNEPNQFVNETCIEQVYHAANIPTDTGAGGHLSPFHAIHDCMNTDGNITNDNVNILLQHQLDTQHDFGIVQIPAITIERQHLIVDRSGSRISAENLFYGICDYYWSITSLLVNTTSIINYPVICDKCGTCNNVIGCLKNNGICVDFTAHIPAASHSQDNHDHKDSKSASSNKSSRSWFWTWFWILLIGGVMYYIYTKHMGGITLLELIGRFRSSSNSSNDRSGLLNNYFQLGTEE